MTEKEPQGRPLAIDSEATGEDPSLPAFLAKPSGSPVYHGFPLLEGVEVEGFRLGKISDFEAEPIDQGDAYVEAPDGRRAGLVWEVSDRRYCEEVMPPGHERWGVWAVGFPHPMTSRENARRNLEAVLPDLRRRWETA
jgi:hypothetical protein